MKHLAGEKTVNSGLSLTLLAYFSAQIGHCSQTKIKGDVTPITFWHFEYPQGKSIYLGSRKVHRGIKKHSAFLKCTELNAITSGL